MAWNEKTHTHTQSEWNFAQSSFFNHFLRRNQVSLHPTYVYGIQYIMKENFSHTFLEEQQKTENTKKKHQTKASRRKVSSLNDGISALRGNLVQMQLNVSRNSFLTFTTACSIYLKLFLLLFSIPRAHKDK